LANVTRWFSLCAAPAVALVFLNDSSVGLELAFGLVRRGNFRHGGNLPSKVGFGPERLARHGVNGRELSGVLDARRIMSR